MAATSRRSRRPTRRPTMPRGRHCSPEAAHCGEASLACLLTREALPATLRRTEAACSQPLSGWERGLGITPPVCASNSGAVNRSNSFNGVWLLALSDVQHAL
eukprot:910008-Rhodomonas_salina.1